MKGLEWRKIEDSQDFEPSAARRDTDALLPDFGKCFPEWASSIDDSVPPRGVAGGIGRRAVRHGRADQRATAGRPMRGSPLHWPTLSSVM
jgi:hypothetical protein